MDNIRVFLSGQHIEPLAILLGLGVMGLLILIALIILALRQGAIGKREAEARLLQSRATEAELAELRGRLAQMTEITSSRQEELVRTVGERLDRITHNLGSNLQESGRNTNENLAKLHERLGTIDSAQKTITELSSRVVSLQDVLSNKQARGAFGQVRMEAIIEDGLPRGSFTFQATLSNGKRPDCLIKLPNTPGGFVIDAKFPLEGFEALRTASDDAARKDAQRRIRIDIGRHIDDMASKYFIAGETQDTALLFVPAESIHAELHDSFADLIQKAHRARIVIVSPNMLMLAVQTMMTIVKDVRMREQASVIQREVGLLLNDVTRLRERVLDFQRHYLQAGPDLEKIVTSSEKIAGRARRIGGFELTDEASRQETALAAAE